MTVMLDMTDTADGFSFTPRSLNQSIVHPREVFSPAVKESAAALILVHNHPTGDPAPSAEDIAPVHSDSNV